MRERGNRIKIEDVLASKGRVKVLKAIINSGEINLTQILHVTGLNYRTAIHHIDFLVRAGLIEEIRIGRARIYRPRWVDPRIRLLEELLSEF